VGGVTLPETAAAIADALAPLTADVADLQIYPFLLVWPTPPAIDVYPATPFMEAHAMGLRQTTWTVRARVGTADHEAGQLDLYRLMEPDKVWTLLREMGGDDLQVLGVSGPSGFNRYLAPQQDAGGDLIGAEWEITVVTDPEPSS
jgi:hypothetical protein